MMRGRAAALVLVFLLGAACGKGESGSPEASPTTGSPATGSPAATGPSAPRTVVPDVVLRNVSTGADVNLRALGLPERPTLYWFWAPH
ncbi:MAG TPA: hypothetical protein VG795_07505 [Acidimicrobiia bacterium]|nr:hypothetical protein [Acidimicrobiia bacterium]